MKLRLCSIVGSAMHSYRYFHVVVKCVGWSGRKPPVARPREQPNLLPNPLFLYFVNFVVTPDTRSRDYRCFLVYLLKSSRFSYCEYSYCGINFNIIVFRDKVNYSANSYIITFN
jgi:hypothetical protein